MSIRLLKSRLCLLLLLAGNQAYGDHPTSTAYIQEFTAATLGKGRAKLGLTLDYGLSNNFDIGTDTLASVAGAPNIKVKYLAWEHDIHKVAVAASMSYFNRNTALWGSVKNRFTELDAQVLRPQVSWSQKLSPRLTLHSYWSISLGTVNAVLSEEGKEYFWNSKYPQGDYQSRTKVVEGSANAEADLDLAHRTIQAQTLMGISRDQFQISGEFQRDHNKKILLTSRISNLELENLKGQEFKVTASQEWRHGHFNFRMGLGMLYRTFSGQDLDGEELDEAGFLPTADFDIYWLI